MKSTKILLAAAALVLSLSASSQTDTSRRDTSAHKMDTTKKKRTLTNNSTTNLQNQPSATVQQATAADASKAADQTNNNSSSTQTNSNSNTNNNGKGSSSTSATYSPAGNNASSSSTRSSTTQSLTPKPNFGRYYIPVLGSYNAVATTTDNKSIKISGDESNPGKIWVDGLTGTKFYALLKTAPGTYKIPAQKSDANTVAEGTLIYDENSKQINLCVGCGYNDQAPAITTNDVAATTTEEHKNGKNHHQQIAKVKKTAVISFSGSKVDQGTVSILQ